MTNDTFPKRIAQVGSDTFVIAREGDQFRMYAPGNPKEVSTVQISDKDTVCTCTDFSENGSDPEYRCKHILAVQKLPNAPIPSPVRAPLHAPEARTSVPSGNGSRHLLLKRSISPDGRIDSLSVEFSLPVGSETDAEVVVEAANAALAIQTVIIAGFLGKESNGNGKETKEENPRETSVRQIAQPATQPNAKPARIIAFGFRPTKWGQRAALTFDVEGDRLTVFGSRDRLQQVLTFAGYAAVGMDLSKPFETDLACQVTVKKTEDGKYTNIDRVYPRAS